MKTGILLFTWLLFATSLLSAETNSATMKVGDGIGRHIQDMKAYQKVQKEVQAKSEIPLDILLAEVATWKVGEGILSVSHSMSAGIINDITYTVPADGENRVVLKVKEFNPKTGELTILIPNKPSHHTAESRAGARLPAAGER